ncbi:hypothetical protein CBL_01344 [Carabus blaptoides fortunei]
MSPTLVEAWPRTFIDMTSSIAHRIANKGGNGVRNGPKSTTRKKINVKNKEKGCCSNSVESVAVETRRNQMTKSTSTNHRSRVLVGAHSVEEVLLNHFIDERLRRINAHVIALFAGPLHVKDDLGDQT